jgi:hypothetical protein
LEVKIMRKSVCVSLMALSLVASILSAAPASAKSVDGLRALIPFDFHVGDRLVPAGEYAVKAMSDNEVAIRIRSADGREGATVLTSAKQAGLNSGASPRLVFHKYGDEYFLAAVWGTDENGRALPESERERSLRRETQVAGSARMEVITVAAR